MGSLVYQLERLVQATEDPFIISFALENLGAGVSPQSCFMTYINRTRKKLARQLVLLRLDPSGGLARMDSARLVMRKDPRLQQRELLTALRRQQEQLLMQSVREQFERMLRDESQRRQLVDSIARDLWNESSETLAAELKDDDPIVRWVAAQVTGARRHPLESELIERLSDSHPLVREAAHQALVRLARGTDFGPALSATAAERTQAIRTWRTWLALQDSSTANPITPIENVETDEASRLSKGLVRASPGDQEPLLQQLKDGKGVVYTEALAQAIPDLTGAVQGKAREALAERLTRMNADTLRDKLKDESREIRRAAALACAMKESKPHIPDLIALLDDKEPLVAQAAHAALKSLSGQDLGPRKDASPAERARAVAAWREWWKKQKE